MFVRNTAVFVSLTKAVLWLALEICKILLPATPQGPTVIADVCRALQYSYPNNRGVFIQIVHRQVHLCPNNFTRQLKS